MEMTIQQRINRFCEKHPEPRQFSFVLYWKRTDGKHEQIIGSDEPLVHWGHTLTRSTGAPFYIQHYLYDEETQLMECSYAAIKCNVPKAGENRKWEYAERYFIPKEEKQIYDISGKTGRYILHTSYRSIAYNAKNFFQAFTRLNTNNAVFANEFYAFTDNDPDLPPRYEGYKYPWIMTEWIQHRRVVKSSETATQRSVNKLTQNQLEDVSEMICNARRTDNIYWRSTYAYFDKDNNVFRIYRALTDSAYEIKRIYINKGRFVTAKISSNGKWVPNGSFTNAQFNATVINPEDFYGLKYHGYLKDLDAKTVYKIVSICKVPEIEQLYNMGCANIAKSISREEFPAAYLRNTLGKPDNKKKNVCQRYKLTKKQFEKINMETDSSLNHIAKMKEYLCIDDLSHMDLDSFALYYDASKKIGWSLKRSLGRLNPDDRKNAFIKLAKLNNTNQRAVQIFDDTISLYNRVANKPNTIVWEVKNCDELIRLHDTLIEIERVEREERQRLYNLSQAERNKELEKKMAKLDEKRKELNYEEDEFIIRIPEKLSEIVNEGSSLHHCVGGYTDRHARGETTILFLRRKSDPNTSFATIELRNNNEIQQIHLFGNAWLGTRPEAIPTVVRWLRKNNIHCDEKILTSTATGYGYNGQCIEMPVVDGKRGV